MQIGKLMFNSVADARLVRDVATMAYGSGKGTSWNPFVSEGKNGGYGYIGILGGKLSNRVVKFGTHVGERLFHTATADEIASCDNLRKKLYEAISGAKIDGKQINKSILDDVRALLDINVFGNVCNYNNEAGLLERKVVAEVITMLDNVARCDDGQGTNKDTWLGLNDSTLHKVENNFENKNSEFASLKEDSVANMWKEQLKCEIRETLIQFQEKEEGEQLSGGSVKFISDISGISVKDYKNHEEMKKAIGNTEDELRNGINALHTISMYMKSTGKNKISEYTQSSKKISEEICTLKKIVNIQKIQANVLKCKNEGVRDLIKSVVVRHLGIKNFDMLQNYTGSIGKLNSCVSISEIMACDKKEYVEFFNKFVEHKNSIVHDDDASIDTGIDKVLELLTKNELIKERNEYKLLALSFLSAIGDYTKWTFNMEDPQGKNVSFEKCVSTIDEFATNKLDDKENIITIGAKNCACAFEVMCLLLGGSEGFDFVRNYKQLASEFALSGEKSNPIGVLAHIEEKYLALVESSIEKCNFDVLPAINILNIRLGYVMRENISLSKALALIATFDSTKEGTQFTLKLGGPVEISEDDPGGFFRKDSIRDSYVIKIGNKQVTKKKNEGSNGDGVSGIVMVTDSGGTILKNTVDNQKALEKVVGETLKDEFGDITETQKNAVISVMSQKSLVVRNGIFGVTGGYEHAPFSEVTVTAIEDGKLRVCFYCQEVATYKEHPKCYVKTDFVIDVDTEGRTASELTYSRRIDNEKAVASKICKEEKEEEKGSDPSGVV